MKLLVDRIVTATDKKFVHLGVCLAAHQKLTSLSVQEEKNEWEKRKNDNFESWNEESCSKLKVLALEVIFGDIKNKALKPPIKGKFGRRFVNGYLSCKSSGKNPL